MSTLRISNRYAVPFYPAARWKTVCRTFLMGLGILALLGFTNQRPKDETLITLTLERLKNRHYYLIEKDYTCTPYVSEGRKVKTYKDHIFFTEDKVIFRGDGCSDKYEALPYDAAQFRFSSDHNLMKYKDKWYEKFVKPPELDDAKSN